jgi:hypothetical protein
MARAVTLSMVVARPHRDGERDVNLHARSARRAPRSGAAVPDDDTTLPRD